MNEKDHRALSEKKNSFEMLPVKKTNSLASTAVVSVKHLHLRVRFDLNSLECFGI